MDKFVIGLDFGTDSVRALLVNASTGEAIASASDHYERWAEQRYCDPSRSQYRQHPRDYIESMTTCIRGLLSGIPKSVVENIVALSADTTGSTPVAVNASGVPLSLLPEFSENANAMFVLWKDHTANAEAEEINSLSHRWETDYTVYSGGVYSSEWYWSKALSIMRKDERVRQHAFTWLEHSDWIPALLTGVEDARNIKRNRCAAGHKALWHETFSGFPSEQFFNTLDERLAGVRRSLPSETFTSDTAVGMMSAEWSSILGLPNGVMVGAGAIDAHFGAVGACIEPFRMAKVMGTSTCDMLVAPTDQFGTYAIEGICGQVNGSVLPNMVGIEAGQSAFGDVYAWFQALLSYPLKLFPRKLSAEETEQVLERILPDLATQASLIPLKEDNLVALDWINGRRTPDANLTLTGGVMGLRLDSDPPRIFKALVESTAFGSRAIADHFKDQGVSVKEVVALGGIARKSPYVMQTLATVMNMPIKVVRSEEACALGAAMFAATVARIFPNVGEAQRAMGSGFERIYEPEIEHVPVYDKLYDRYKALGRFNEEFSNL